MGEITLPSIIPSYVYTLFASLIVGTILICACGVSAANLKQEADKQQLLNISEYIATKSLELILHATNYNVTSNLQLNIPTLAGTQRYWIQLANDSTRAWVETGFGTTLNPNTYRIYIPAEVTAEGTYLSDFGVAALECHTVDGTIYLKLSGGS
ncbi:MAG: hypothetical protein QXU99_05745 [Candidatus Bathyarchaeia archaeon]